jgi:uncharacterized alkaline shock family protein YloU
MRRWARTRFIPTDWGLKPPIEVLPQIAHIRDMVEKDSEIREGNGAPDGPRRLVTIHDSHGGQLAEWAAREREDMDEREVGRVVRAAAESVYGVAAVVGPSFVDRLATRLNLGRSGVSVQIEPELRVTVDLKVAEGVPQRQVAANVAEKVRYVVERDLGRHISQLTVRVDGRPPEERPRE